MEKSPPSQSLLMVIAMVLVLVAVLLAFIAGMQIPARPTVVLVTVVITATPASRVVATTPIPTTTPSASLMTPVASPTIRPSSPVLTSPTFTFVARTSIPLPKASTATPLPLKPVTTTITNEMATSIAAQKAIVNGLQVENPSVTFTKEDIQFTGRIMVSHIPGVSSIFGTLKVIGKPHCENDNINILVTSVTINNTNLTQNDVRRSIERTINEIISEFLGIQRVKSCILSDGKLTIFAVIDPN